MRHRYKNSKFKIRSCKTKPINIIRLPVLRYVNNNVIVFLCLHYISEV
jgi:hypothetical protein